ncbi:hypothetical protein JW979_01315, partial [bacterium]|nr:hypothetical protein [candidate division CSSED10-310 bacterium]
LISLTGKKWLPNCLIRWLRDRTVIRKNPALLKPLIRLNSWIRWFVKGIPFLLKGHANRALIRMIFQRRRYIFTSTK